MLALKFSSRDFWHKLRHFADTDASRAGVHESVRAILADVHSRGDAAVRAYSARFDGFDPGGKSWRVPPADLAAAAASLPHKHRRAIREAIRCVRDFHRHNLPRAWSARNRHGARVGERFYPIRNVGLYIPGGQVPLVSTVIMTVVPAKIAGNPRIAVTTPPRADGTVNPSLLAALHLCGVDEVYRIGGVQAVAAFAYGTATIPAVDKLFGPGNAYVTEAKRQLFGVVGIDLLPGPSEAMVIADGSARPEWVAADLLAQAEHGSGKEKIYLAATGAAIIRRVNRAIERRLPALTHRKAMEKVLDGNYVTVETRSLEQAAEAANFIAPEHLELHVAPRAIAKLASTITTAGAILQGGYSPTVVGDFTAGPSHTLPTGRTGRFFSGLRLADFMRRTSTVRYDKSSLRRARATVQAFGEMEQLDAHAASLNARFENP